jgi:hypothetical protein
LFYSPHKQATNLEKAMGTTKTIRKKTATQIPGTRGVNMYILKQKRAAVISGPFTIISF